MKRRLFLAVLFSVFSVMPLLSSTTVNIFGTNVLRIQKYLDNGTLASNDYDYTQNIYNNSIGRSIYEFDLPANFPNNAIISQIKIRYRHLQINSDDYNALIGAADEFTHTTNQQDWNYTEAVPLLGPNPPSGLYAFPPNRDTSYYSAGSDIPMLDSILQNIIVAGKTKLFLVIRSGNESRTGGYPGDLHAIFKDIKLEITYNLGVRYVLKNNIEAGQLYVSSSTKTGYVNSGQNIIVPTSSIVSLAAVEPQTINSIQYVWNDNEGVSNKSYWGKYDSSGVLHGSNYSTTLIDTAKSTENNYTLKANLRKYLSISRSEQSEFDGTSSAGVVAQIVEGNTGQITAPATKTLNGRPYNFAGWTDGDTTNPRTISSPTASTIDTALYKYPNHTNYSYTAYFNNQRKLIRTTDTTKLYKVYESINKVWLEVSTNNGSTWMVLNNGMPLNTGNAKCASLCTYGATVGVVYQEQYESGFRIKLRFFQENNYCGFGPYVISTESDESYSTHACPVITWVNGGKLLIVYETKNFVQ
jgi:hypothetical protein